MVDSRLLTIPVSDLSAMLRGMQPERIPGEFAYVLWPVLSPKPDVPILAAVREAEGETLVLRAEDAEALGLQIHLRAAWITLNVHSDLAASGLTAAFSRVLADAGVSCNVLAGTYHDHLLVPAEQADKALAALIELQRSAETRDNQCRNCLAMLTGPSCAQCGQARFVESDRRMSHLVRQFFDNLTSLDSRFWRSLLGLMFRPGLLTRDYLDGRRQRWMAPVSLFLLANLLYFFAPAINDFELPFGDQVPGAMALAANPALQSWDEPRRERLRQSSGQIHSSWTASWVTRRVAERDAAARTEDPSSGYSVADYARAYDARSADVSKLLIIMHVPMMALMSMLVLWFRRRYFAEHMVVSLHLFAFVLMVTMTVLLPIEYLVRWTGWPIESVRNFSDTSM